MAVDMNRFRAVANSFNNIKIGLDSIPPISSRGMWEAYIGTITVLTQKFENVKMSMYDLISQIESSNEFTKEEKAKFKSQLNEKINKMISILKSKKNEFEAAAEKFGFITREKVIKQKLDYDGRAHDVAEVKTKEDPRIDALRSAFNKSSITYTNGWLDLESIGI